MSNDEMANKVDFFYSDISDQLLLVLLPLLHLSVQQQSSESMGEIIVRKSYDYNLKHRSLFKIHNKIREVTKEYKEVFIKLIMIIS